MWRADNFDRTGEPITREEFDELLTFCATEYPALWVDLVRASREVPFENYAYLYRTIYDDMCRVKAGGFPRYCPFPPQRIGTAEVWNKQ